VHSETIHLEKKEAGVLHVHSNGAGTVHIKAGPLRCHQAVVPAADCLYTLETSDELRINVGALVAQSDRKSPVVGFAFRTDQPSSSFLRLSTEGGDTIEVHLQDGEDLIE